MAKVRFQMFLDTHQKEALEKLQKNSKTPVAELIRNRFKDYRTITATWLETSVVLADVCVRKG